MGDFDGAIADCSEALRLDPNRAVVWNLRGCARIQKGEYHDGLADCSESLRLNPLCADAWALRGRAKLDWGDHKGAIVDCLEALRLDSSRTDALETIDRAKQIETAAVVNTMLVSESDKVVQLGTAEAASRCELTKSPVEMDTQSCAEMMMTESTGICSATEEGVPKEEAASVVSAAATPEDVATACVDSGAPLLAHEETEEQKSILVATAKEQRALAEHFAAECVRLTGRRPGDIRWDVEEAAEAGGSAAARRAAWIAQQEKQIARLVALEEKFEAAAEAAVFAEPPREGTGPTRESTALLEGDVANEFAVVNLDEVLSPTSRASRTSAWRRRAGRIALRVASWSPTRRKRLLQELQADDAPAQRGPQLSQMSRVSVEGGLEQSVLDKLSVTQDARSRSHDFKYWMPRSPRRMAGPRGVAARGMWPGRYSSRGHAVAPGQKPAAKQRLVEGSKCATDVLHDPEPTGTAHI
eukprot:gnl/TRDRNA2_/TRDRNA2_169495_c2_seq1.p1 gnl/TRDRNA2_/TRDRNA2_169495_c2~~gnl/TRDRNA2_/TRDRNA2_169495_c2_seq1.p1  ORF type:complete len:471 (-),score=65.95 gnl/TRDRNA2_/TRDRNA2_169495_c2_seq1:126-1538(-)